MIKEPKYLPKTFYDLLLPIGARGRLAYGSYLVSCMIFAGAVYQIEPAYGSPNGWTTLAYFTVAFVHMVNCIKRLNSADWSPRWAVFFWAPPLSILLLLLPVHEPESQEFDFSRPGVNFINPWILAKLRSLTRLGMPGFFILGAYSSISGDSTAPAIYFFLCLVSTYAWMGLNYILDEVDYEDSVHTE